MHKLLRFHKCTLKGDLDEVNGSLEQMILVEDIKDALLACFENVAWKNGKNGEDYYDALEAALSGGEDEFYNTYEWSLSDNLSITSGTSTVDTTTGDLWINVTNGGANLKRRKVATVSKGKKPYVDYTTRQSIGVYPVPVPRDAVSCTITTSNTKDYNIGAEMYIYDKINNKYIKTEGTRTTIAGPTVSWTFNKRKNGFMMVLFSRPNNADFATGEPSSVSITFGREGQ